MQCGCSNPPLGFRVCQRQLGRHMAACRPRQQEQQQNARGGLRCSRLAVQALCSCPHIHGYMAPWQQQHQQYQPCVPVQHAPSNSTAVPRWCLLLTCPAVRPPVPVQPAASGWLAPVCRHPCWTW